MKTFNYKIIYLILLIFVGIVFNVSAQVGIGTNTPDSTSILEIKSTNKGILVPRMTTAQRTGISSPATGLLVFDTDSSTFWYHSGSWVELTTGSPNKITDADNDTKVEVEQGVDEDMIRFSTSNTERMQIDNSGNTRIGDGTNNTYIEPDGSLSFEGDATRYDDLRVPMSSAKTKGIVDPNFILFKNDGSGSVGVYTFAFSTSKTEELFFDVQLPHAWIEGTDIYPHIHWSPKTNTGGNKVRWGFEFVWVNVGGTFGNSTVIYAEDPIASITNPTAYQHVISAFPAIDGTGKTLSSMLVCRVFRDGTHANDTYDNDAYLLEFDFHFEIDAYGSREAFTK